MPCPDFFSKLGLYIAPNFLSASECRRLIGVIASSPMRPGLVIGGSGTSRLDGTRRSVGDANVPSARTAELKQSLIDLRPVLETHFDMPLEWGGEGPDYLVYQTGDFFKPHVDNYEDHPGPNSRILRRRVAVVLFLNGHSREQRENCFGGGLLNFYGLLDGPRWEQCAFGLEAEPGLLVAFPAGIVHEVTPITFGERYSVLTAFHTAAAPSSH